MASSIPQSVMVIEDEADIRDSLTELLESEGYETQSAPNGREALKKLRNSGRPPDAILLDMMMPVMDGLSFRWEQLADPSLAAIPVIILSASGYCEASAIELDTAGVLKKPCSSDKILETLKRICGAHP